MQEKKCHTEASMCRMINRGGEYIESDFIIKGITFSSVTAFVMKTSHRIFQLIHSFTNEPTHSSMSPRTWDPAYDTLPNRQVLGGEPYHLANVVARSLYAMTIGEPLISNIGVKEGCPSLPPDEVTLAHQGVSWRNRDLPPEVLEKQRLVPIDTLE